MTGRRQAVLDQVKAKHPKLHTIQSDVADPAQIAALAARVKADFPKLDVLMNNAGIMLYKNLKAPAADLAGLMAEMNVNVGGVIGMTSAFIDILTANKGTVINVSSGARLRAAASRANLLRHQGRDSLLHPVAAVPIGGNRRGGHRAHAPGGEDRHDGRACRRAASP